MRCPCRPGREAMRGFALLTVTVFALVLTIAGMIVFSLSSSETKGALYRQRSSEAFYAADGAIERARAKFLEDRAWRTGWTGAPAGTGGATYDLTVVDTTYQGHDNCVMLTADGHRMNAARRIRVFAQVPPTGFEIPLLVGGNFDTNGNICLDGTVHVDGDPGHKGLKCGGVVTHGYDITPPPMYTVPDSFPGKTYYSVRGTKIGTIYQAKIYDRHGVDITASKGDNLAAVTSYSGGNYSFSFSGASVAHYFDDATGIFNRTAGDGAVVVNFGEAPVWPVGGNGFANLSFDQATGTSIHTTIIDTRFTGTTTAQRLDPNFWLGGTVTAKKTTMEPYGGIALLIHDLDVDTQISIGSDAWPALVYATGDLTSAHGGCTFIGSIIVLGNWSNNGNMTIQYDPGFIEHLPGYLQNDWPSGVSGTLKVLDWKELAAS
jgi:hypothetical protein